MFHRVKSEEVQDDPQDERVDEQESASPAENSRIESLNSRIAKEPKQPEEKVAAQENTSTPNQKKEASFMNAQAEDNNSGNERVEKQAEQPRTHSFENYQRQPGRAAPGGYPGAYPGSSYAAPATAAERDSASDRTLTIGAGITMSGEIESCDQLIVEGTIEASLKSAHVLDVAETGTFYGTVEIDEAVIAGRFEGDLTVNGRLVVRQGGTISGTIAYRELEVEAGAVIEGKITPLKSAPQAELAPTPKVKEAAPVAKSDSKEQRHAPANTDGQGLFSDKAVAAE
ncbi:MAG: hypothetical protein DHS20C02_09670 [Micavibrio sp.]|nr:MAG: hypothetical protein DHS20C02_09670 [Micavibrio sp.]